MISIIELLSLIWMGLAIGTIMCSLYKKHINKKLIDDVNYAIANGGQLKLSNGIILDFDNGIILNSHGKQIKCIYR